LTNLCSYDRFYQIYGDISCFVKIKDLYFFLSNLWNDVVFCQKYAVMSMFDFSWVVAEFECLGNAVHNVAWGNPKTQESA
jgi:hypothetical protein